jgi:acyl carrier protein
MDDLKRRVKEMIVERLGLEGLRPEEIDDDAPLFGEGLGLDSIDALELSIGLEKAFGVKLETEEEGKRAFASVSALAEHLASRGLPR